MTLRADRLTAQSPGNQHNTVTNFNRKFPLWPLGN
jgi:hypothetical protein